VPEHVAWVPARLDRLEAGGGADLPARTSRSSGLSGGPTVRTLQARRQSDGARPPTNQEDHMLLIRDLMFCKPGKVRPMVEKFKAMKKLSEGKGMGTMRILTDLSAERYWTVISEIEVESLDAFMKMGRDAGPETKEMEKIMADYHDLVESGRREIYTVEG
jgi:hypothetical protein